MLDKIVVSCDDSDFKLFWPIVVKAWNKYMPNVKVVCAFVSDRDDKDPVVVKMREYGDVYIFPVDSNIPKPNQAKIARFLLASIFTNEICMIEDIDTIPLQSDYFFKRISQRKSNTMLFVGSEIYGSDNPDKFPISTMTGEGILFEKLFLSHGISDLLKNFRFDVGVSKFISQFDNNQIDGKESVFNNRKNEDDIGFSDESLIRLLMTNSDIEVTKIERDVDIHSDWIDRSWWGFNVNKLMSNGYICCNFKRPFQSHYEDMKPIIDYIMKFDTQLSDFVVN